MSMGKDEANDRALLKILEKKPANTIAVFSKGEYFTVYGDDARFVASNIFKSDICLKSFALRINNAQQMKYVSVNRGQYEKVVRESLVLLRVSVELYSTANGEYKVIKKGSPGNTVEFEQEVGVVDQAPNFALYLHPSEKDNRVTLCAWDAGNVRIIVSEFNDTPTFSQVEQCIFGLSPSEYIVINKDKSEAKFKKLATMFSKMEVHVKPRTLGEELKPKSDWQNVLECVDDASKDEINSKNEYIKECIQVLHANVCEGYSDTEKYCVLDYGAHGNMQLDSCAVEALELFQLNYNYLEKNNTMTLFNIVNKCKTLPGEKMLRNWISRPLCQIEHIVERQDIVEALIESQTIRKKLRDSILAKMPDCAQLARRLMRKCTLQDLNRYYQTTVLLESIEMQLIELRKSGNGRFENAVDRLLRKDIDSILERLHNFQVLCDQFLDFEYEKETKEIRVRVDFLEEITVIKDKLDYFESIAQKLRRRFATELKIDNLKVDKNANYGYYFRCTLKEEKQLRGADVTILETTKGSGVKFMVDKLSNINEEFMEYHLQYVKAEEAVFKMLCEKAKEFIPLIPSIANLVSTLDVFVALATFASTSTRVYVRPKLLPMGSKQLKLVQCRHPVIEATSERPFIPNNVNLEKDRLIVLTGANMGGKSTYLRSAALSILLAQIGSFVPCDEAIISVVDGIYTRVGASDKQSRGISTFMAEMLDCSAILQRATVNSFVVIDELGRGTSTFDGYGIASAIAQDILTRIKCLCVFATHFHEMGQLAEIEGAVALQMGVKIDGNDIHMLYKVLDGVAQCSYGLQVAKMVGIDQKIIEKASCLLETLEKKIVIDEEKKTELLSSENIREAIIQLVK